MHPDSSKNSQKISAEEDARFMRLAMHEAEAAGAADEVPVGAIIVARGQVIGRGHNLCERLNDFTAHAEMQAFTAASEFLGGKHLDQCTLYVTLEPCPMCAGAAFWTRIGRIVYGASDPKRGFERFAVESGLLHPKTKVSSGILGEECGNIVREFFTQKRRPKNR